VTAIVVAELIDGEGNAMDAWQRLLVKALRTTAKRAIGRGRNAPGVTPVDDVVGELPVRRFWPAGSAPGTRMVYFHGGGFISGSINTHHALCSALAAGLGVELVSVGYRLAPEHPAPAQLDDALAATATLADGTDRLLLAGDSAGAYLACRAALKLNRAQPGRVAGQLLLYPFIDLAAEADTLHMHAKPAVALIRNALQDHYKALPTLDLGAAPPTVIAGGSILDPVAPGAALLEARLRGEGAAVISRRYGGLVHGALNLVNRLNGIDRIIAEVCGDARSHFALPAPAAAGVAPASSSPGDGTITSAAA
jgi:acetyl esterase